MPNKLSNDTIHNSVRWTYWAAENDWTKNQLSLQFLPIKVGLHSEKDCSDL